MSLARKLRRAAERAARKRGGWLPVPELAPTFAAMENYLATVGPPPADEDLPGIVLTALEMSRGCYRFKLFDVDELSDYAAAFGNEEALLQALASPYRPGALRLIACKLDGTFQLGWAMWPSPAPAVNAPGGVA